MLFSLVVLPSIVLSADTDGENSSEQLTELIPCLTPHIKDIVSSFAVARNEFEGCVNGSRVISDLATQIRNIESQLANFEVCKARAQHSENTRTGNLEDQENQLDEWNAWPFTAPDEWPFTLGELQERVAALNESVKLSLHKDLKRVTKRLKELTKSKRRNAVPAAFQNAECSVKLRFNVVHYTDSYTAEYRTKRYPTKKLTTKTETYKTNGHYKLLDASDPRMKFIRSTRMDREIDLDAGVFFQDGPNGYSKAVTTVPGEDAENDKGAYLIVKIRSDFSSMISKELEARQFEDRWAVLFIDNIDNINNRLSFPLCTSNTKCAVPPAFARDWSPTPSINFRWTRSTMEECACDDEGSA